MKKQFRITCTHNPQDFYNGIEPSELTKAYTTSNLEEDAAKELENGYQVVVTKGDESIETENKQKTNSI
jgi:hypothetical protein